MSLANLAKILKCAGNDDIITMKAAEDGDTVTFMFESPSACCCCWAAIVFVGRRTVLCCVYMVSRQHEMPATTTAAATTTTTTTTQPTLAHYLYTSHHSLPGDDRVSDFELKLMDIDSDHLGIPDTEYSATINMPAAEYQRICRDLASIGDTGTDRQTAD
jgi:Proliferating cell nuclear antigen, N-terminal domain/Proliferating cell nuclear antigen, C-terminal domain